MADVHPTWSQVSDRALLARFHGLSALEAQAKVTSLFYAVVSGGVPGIRNLHPAFTTLLVVYDPLEWTPEALVQRLERAERQTGENACSKPPIKVPACFDTQFALDLPEVAARTGLRAEEVAGRFVSAIYRVAFLGFAPGFPYLLGLPPELASPRLQSPRTRVPAGSIGIAGIQTGIYPAETPGGWRIVGRTPLRLFDPKQTPMSLLLPGDEVRFEPVDARRFEELSQW